MLGFSDHIVFNSFSQWDRFKDRVRGHRKKVRCGLRVNPEHSEVKVPLYDPCAPFSRLGITRGNFREEDLEGISGLHFHTLCELNADSLARTLPVFEEKFGGFLQGMQWVNFGGGHHITRADYDLDLLCELITGFRKRYPVEVIPRTRRSDRPAYRGPDRLRAGPPPQRDGHRHPGHFRRRSHARRPRNALPAGNRRRGRTGGISAHIPTRRADLSCRGRDRGLFLSPSAYGRLQAGFHGYGPLYDGQEQHVQRSATPVHRRSRQAKPDTDRPAIRLRRLPESPFIVLSGSAPRRARGRLLFDDPDFQAVLASTAVAVGTGRTGVLFPGSGQSPD